MNVVVCDQCHTDITDLPQYNVVIEEENLTNGDWSEVEATVCRPCAKTLGAI